MQENNILALNPSIGNHLKKELVGYQAWLHSTNHTALKKIGLRPSKKLTIYIGALACKFQCFEWYSGSKKRKYDKPQEGKGLRGQHVETTPKEKHYSN